MEMSSGEWSGYAPITGPAPGTRCFVCGAEQADNAERQWLVAGDQAICGECVRRTAQSFARQEGLEPHEWIDSARQTPGLG